MGKILIDELFVVIDLLGQYLDNSFACMTIPEWWLSGFYGLAKFAESIMDTTAVSGRCPRTLQTSPDSGGALIPSFGEVIEPSIPTA
jgi:hypothetical protein